MWNMRLRVRAVALLALGTACSTTAPGLSNLPPAGVTGDRVRVDEATPSILSFPSATADDVWRTLPAAFRHLGIEAGVMDRDAPSYGSVGVRLTTIAGKPARTLFRCTNEGTGMSSMTQYRIEFAIAAQPRTVAGAGAELIVRTQALGRFVDARSGTVHCVSNGSIENALKEHIDAELERMKK